MPRLQLPKFLQSKLEKEILKEKDAAAREGLTEDNFFTYSYHCNAIGRDKRREVVNSKETRTKLEGDSKGKTSTKKHFHSYCSIATEQH